jgi:serum/glucocorticoid-regulated kinase 2
MPGALVHPQKSPPTEKKKFGTVRGIGAAIKDSSGSLSNQIQQSWSVGRDTLPLNRRSRDTAPGSALKYGYVKRRKHRAVLQLQQLQQPSVTDVEFFETTTSPSADSFVLVESMKHFDPRYPRRPLVRIDNQDGPWTVSVAETPHDPHSYSLYVKSAFSLSFFLLSNPTLLLLSTHP